jgi:hypothetical protein
VCSLRGEALTDSDLCILFVTECSWKERLVFAVDLPAPYLDEKLSGWRGLRANMVQSQRSDFLNKGMLRKRTRRAMGSEDAGHGSMACSNTCFAVGKQLNMESRHCNVSIPGS